MSSMSSQPNEGGSPWHEGELAIQRSVGVVDVMDTPGRKFVRTFLLDQHRTFFPLLPFVVLGAVDPEGEVWATIRSGHPGFLHSPDDLTLSIDTTPDPSDPAERGLRDGEAIGLLGIDLITRRRNRLNGRVRRDGNASKLDISVAQSFGNCPRYIQNRDLAFVREPSELSAAPVRVLPSLDDRAREIIQGSDSFFVASYVDQEHGGRQVDASHRGGKPGFVRIDDDGRLTVPDFNGNLFFNTLGNFLLNPRAGLAFVDPDSGDLLQMTGRAEVILESPEIASFKGAERIWRFMPTRVVHRPGATPMRWVLRDGGQSPSLEMTGSWIDAQGRLEAAARSTTWRPFRINRVVEESALVRSLHLEPVDGGAIVLPMPGQHLPVKVALPCESPEAIRTYTLSVAPSDGFYRISVKRQGRVSAFLHTLKVGDVVEARGPAGAFTADSVERRAAVLLAAGIGVTPMLAMVRHFVHEGRRTRHLRRTWLFQSSRNLLERPFDHELQELVEASDGRVNLVRVLSSPGEAVQGRDFDAAGRITMALLQEKLPFGDHDFYLCGPAAFMQDLYDQLRKLNVPDARIHAEAFGPSSIRRLVDRSTDRGSRSPASIPVAVIFTESAKEARWTPGDGSLLELAEARGLNPAFGCRGGSCGSCKVAVMKGKVVHPSNPSFNVADGQALLCCAMPADGGGDTLHLAA